ncbi:DUF6270 domain-containing protein [Leucobacter sp. NPDC015123]|uniref:DUF6270 domain-containing protein n=1 Tax=Leucobacter sp. NPDC015123 TaxID=3364129 RepID=UPI0036F45177
MSISSGTHTSHGIEVKYIFRPAQKDCRHLIVLFSGFRSLGSVDFAGSTVKNLRANVLWLVDEFDGHRSYYVRGYGGDDVANAVRGTIEYFRSSLGLPKSQVSLAGFSKGGSAALFHAITGDYDRVLATAPQLRIGTYVANHWEEDLDAMGGRRAIEFLDSLLESAIRADENTSRNIYLITATADEQYASEARPLAELLERYENLTVIVSETPFITTHVDVTRYNVPLVLSLLTLFSEGFTPQLTQAEGTQNADARANVTGQALTPTLALRNGSLAHPPLAKYCEPTHTFRAAISMVTLEGGVLNFEGFAYFQGVPVDAYGQIATSLIILGADKRWTIRLGGTNDPKLSLQEFCQRHIDYSHAAITTISHTGIPLHDLPTGRYSLSLESIQNTLSATSDNVKVAEHSTWTLFDKTIAGTYQNAAGTWELLVLPAVGREAVDSYFEERVCELIDGRLFLEGYFVPRGLTLSRWQDIRFSLTIVEPGTGDPNHRILCSMPLATGSKADASSRSGEGWRDQSKGYYATPHYRGVQLGDLPGGNYELFVTARTGDNTQSARLQKTLKVSGQWRIGEMPRFGVIGSCVTRDNFSSRIVPGWKKDYTLHGANYQMSLVSLMSGAVHFDDKKFSDLDPHAFEATKRDFTKEYLDEIADDRPHYLLLDTFADARFGVVADGDSWVTDNVWKLGQSAAYEDFADSRRVSPALDLPQFSQLFRSACARLRLFLDANSPETQVIVVRSRNASAFRGLSSTGSFSTDPGRQLDLARGHLEDIALQELDAASIDLSTESEFASSDHPWGRGPVHYERTYYKQFREKLLRLIGYEAQFSLN